MGVSLPSDLILDVMRNADPAKVRVATAKLEAQSLDGGMSDGFATALNGLNSSHGTSRITRSSPGDSPKVYEDFERMVLRNLMESMLPSVESATFGTGPSAGVWRSLAADQLAGLYAGSGGIGIAASLSPEGEGADSTRSAQWPYFQTDQIEAFSG